jgi:glycosyltransferase involved in cell wall biosynthesis
VRVLHISPTYFGDRSYVGGGERYAYELARAMARTGEVVFLSFAAKAASHWDGPLRVEYLRRSLFFRNNPLSGSPFSHRFGKWTQWADAIHCHQAHTLGTDLAIILSRLRGKRCFVTDLGGGHSYALSNYLPLDRWVHRFLLISEYSRRLWQRDSHNGTAERLDVIYGGVDCEQFKPAEVRKSDRTLFVGRLLPHKGIDYLIDAVADDTPLDVVGRVYHDEYFNLLKAKSAGKPVTFFHRVTDDELVQKYREALVTVLPSVYQNCYGHCTEVPELLGLVVLESLACGTPVIVTNVASLPEVVEDGVTGFVVPPNDPKAIHDRMSYLRSHPELAVEMGRRGRDMVLRQFTWDAVVRRCLEAYGQSN